MLINFLLSLQWVLGCRVVIIDGPDSWAKTLVDEKVIEKFYPVDFTDEAAIFDKCLARIKQAEKVSPIPAQAAEEQHLRAKVCFLMQGRNACII